MNFVLDMGVCDFIRTHAASRGVIDPRATADRVIRAANKLAGEPFQFNTQLTQLSGGQSRALMIVDAALLSWAPVLLIDEIENAGVDKTRPLDLLKKATRSWSSPPTTRYRLCPPAGEWCSKTVPCVT